MGKFLSVLISLAVLGGLLLTFVVPWFTGGQTLVVAPGDAAGEHEVGDVLITGRVDAAPFLGVGDVVSLSPTSQGQEAEMAVVTSVGSDGSLSTGPTAQAQGQPVHIDQVQGKVLFKVPQLGHAMLLAQQYAPYSFHALGVLMILFGLQQLAVALRVSLDLWRATRPILAPQMARA